MSFRWFMLPTNICKALLESISLGQNMWLTFWTCQSKTSERTQINHFFHCGLHGIWPVGNKRTSVYQLHQLSTRSILISHYFICWCLISLHRNFPTLKITVQSEKIKSPLLSARPTVTKYGDEGSSTFEEIESENIFDWPPTRKDRCGILT